MKRAIGALMTSRTASGVTYATWNPADQSANITLSGGNLTVARNGGTGNVRATIAKTSGKWYWEIKINSFTTVCDVPVGLANATASLATLLGNTIDGWSLVLDDGTCLHNGFDHILGAFTTAVNDVIGCALDMDAGTMKFYKNNTIVEAVTFSGIVGTIYPAMGVQNNAVSLTANFGASAMAFSPPAGYNPGVYT